MGVFERGEVAELATLAAEEQRAARALAMARAAQEADARDLALSEGHNERIAARRAVSRATAARPITGSEWIQRQRDLAAHRDEAQRNQLSYAARMAVRGNPPASPEDLRRFREESASPESAVFATDATRSALGVEAGPATQLTMAEQAFLQTPEGQFQSDLRDAYSNAPQTQDILPRVGLDIARGINSIGLQGVGLLSSLLQRPQALERFRENALIGQAATTPQDHTFADTLVEGIASTVPFMGITGMVNGALLAKLPERILANPKFKSNVLPLIYGGIEAVLNADDTYRELVARGDESAFAKTVMQTLVETAANATLARFGLFAGGMPSRGIRYAADALTEGGQEGLQSIFPALAMGEPVDWREVAESAAVGAVAGPAVELMGLPGRLREQRLNAEAEDLRRGQTDIVTGLLAQAAAETGLGMHVYGPSPEYHAARTHLATVRERARRERAESAPLSPGVSDAVEANAAMSALSAATQQKQEDEAPVVDAPGGEVRGTETLTGVPGVPPAGSTVWSRATGVPFRVEGVDGADVTLSTADGGESSVPAARVWESFAPEQTEGPRSERRPQVSMVGPVAGDTVWDPRTGTPLVVVDASDGSLLSVRLPGGQVVPYGRRAVSMAAPGIAHPPQEDAVAVGQGDAAAPAAEGFVAETPPATEQAGPAQEGREADLAQAAIDAAMAKQAVDVADVADVAHAVAAAEQPVVDDAATGFATPDAADSSEPQTHPREKGHGAHPADIYGDNAVVRTPRGLRVDTRYRVAEAADLIASHQDGTFAPNPGYPATLQPRDRSRAASIGQVERIASGLDPDLLGESLWSSDGAPVVAPDGVVESGNGRTMAIRSAYSGGQGEGYRRWLVENAPRFGVSSEAISAMRAPVLVRERTTPMNEAARARFASESNEAQVARMSPAEQAKQDATRMGPDLMRLFAPAEDGNLDVAGNREFLTQFIHGVVPESERPTMVAADGRISRPGLERVRNAVVSMAYGDPRILDRVSESTDDAHRNLVGALVSAAPAMASLRQQMAQGVVHHLDVAPFLADAISRWVAAKGQGDGVDALLGQRDLFGEQIPKETRALIQFFEDNRRSRRNIQDMLSGYVHRVEAAGDPRTPPLFDMGVQAPSVLSALTGAMAGISTQVPKGRQAELPLSHETSAATDPVPQGGQDGREERAAHEALRRAAEAMDRDRGTTTGDAAAPAATDQPAVGIGAVGVAGGGSAATTAGPTPLTGFQPQMTFVNPKGNESVLTAKFWRKGGQERTYVKYDDRDAGYYDHKARRFVDAARYRWGRDWQDAIRDRVDQAAREQDEKDLARARARASTQTATLPNGVVLSQGKDAEGRRWREVQTPDGIVMRQDEFGGMTFEGNLQQAVALTRTGADGRLLLDEGRVQDLFRNAFEGAEQFREAGTEASPGESVVVSENQTALPQGALVYEEAPLDAVPSRGDNRGKADAKPQEVENRGESVTAGYEGDQNVLLGRSGLDAEGRVPHPEPGPDPDRGEGGLRGADGGRVSGDARTDQAAADGEGSAGVWPESAGSELRSGREGDLYGQPAGDPGRAVGAPGGGGRVRGRGGRGDGGRGDGGRGVATGTEQARGENVDPAPDRGQDTAPAGKNFRASTGEIAPQGDKAKVRGNLDAIRVLRSLEAGQRQATPEEQRVLSRYVGWGGLPGVFQEWGKAEKEFAEERRELLSLLSPDEYEAARSSTTNAHYTSMNAVRAIWGAIESLGFTGGKVLEPSMGTGNFFAAMPDGVMENSQLVGVEMDPITGKIARHLFPEAKVFVAPFQDTRLPDGYFDLVVGNVPFASVIPYDAEKKNRYQLHNYFFRKAVDKTRPGGVVAFITSTGTMDGGTDAADLREALSAETEMLGAVRLPDTTFQGNAGTSVTTDLIFLRKLHPGEAPTGEAWEKVEWGDVPGAHGVRTSFRVNEYYARHPENLLGTPVRNRMYSANDNGRMSLHHDGLSDLGGDIRAALGRTLAGAGRPMAAKPVSTQEGPSRVEAGVGLDTGSEYPGTIRVIDGVPHEADSFGILRPRNGMSSGDIRRMVGLIELRDLVGRLTEAQVDPARTSEEVESARDEARNAYEGFVRTFGRVSTPKNAKLLAGDPWQHRVAQLEVVNKKGEFEAVADILSTRTASPLLEFVAAANPQEALVVSLSRNGRVDPGYMLRLLGKEDTAPNRTQLERDLGGLVFVNPASGNMEPSDRYLSGDVREKLARAETAASLDDRYQRNVEALRAVQPEDIPVNQIYLHPGAGWIPADILERFLGDSVFGVHQQYVTATNNEGTGDWTIKVRARPSAVASRWGVQGMGAEDLVLRVLNGRDLTVYREDEDGTRRRDTAASVAAREKADELQREFARFVQETEGVGDRVGQIYNRTFNALREWVPDGSTLTFPGMSRSVELKPHQSNAVWRSLFGNTLLAHCVGAGKTFEMIASAMEMRRMGIARKPMIVVPVSVLPQFEADIHRLYPNAKVIVLSAKDLSPEPRRRQGEGEAAWAERQRVAEQARRATLSRVGMFDWDIVLCSHTTAARIPVSPSAEAEIVAEELSALRSSLLQAKDDKADSRTVKGIEKSMAKHKERLAMLSGAKEKDQVISFDEMGVDQLFVDEAHYFKNLFFATSKGRIRGLSRSESKRATDLFIKTRMLTKRNGGRGVVLATGTPVSNSLAEMWTMLRFLDYEGLKRRGLHTFDAWCKNFAVEEQSIEFDAASNPKMATVLSRFVNMPELMALFRSVADIKMQEDLGLEIPTIRGGSPEVVSVPAHPRMGEFLSSIVERLEAIHSGAVDPREDNALKCTTDARKAALDLRLVWPDAGPAPATKADICADNAFEIWRETAGDRGAQMVFLDFSTPKPQQQDEEAEIDEWDVGADSDETRFRSVYESLRDALIARGIPREEVAFVGDASSAEKKNRLQEAIRNGDIRVVIGSTTKLGVGINAQDRLVALHHLDCPWRPADIEQREGRILRQGNRNKQVRILRYVTEGSFDASMWSTVARKAGMVHQAMRGQASREMEDISESQISYSEAAAVAAGDTRILDLFRMRQNVARLDALVSDWEARKARLVAALRREEQGLRDHARAAKAWGEAAKQYLASKARFEKSTVQFQGRRPPVETETDWADAVDRAMGSAASKRKLPWEPGKGLLNSNAQSRLDWATSLDADPVVLGVVNGGVAELRAVAPAGESPLGVKIVMAFPSGAGLSVTGVSSIRASLGGVAQHAAGAQQSVETATGRIASLRNEIQSMEGPSPHQEELHGTRRRVADLEASLGLSSGQEQPNGEILALPAPIDTPRPGRPTPPPRRRRAAESQKHGGPVQISDIWEAMRRTGPVREGKTGRGSLGTYGQGTDVIRTRYAGDLDTAMHELGHRVDQWGGFSERAAGTPWRVELERAGLAVSPKGATPGRVLQEGVAQFLRHRATNPDEAGAKFPKFSLEFDAFLQRGPRGGEIQRILDMATEYRTQDIQERVIAAIGGNEAKGKRTPWGSRLAEGWRRFYDLWFDELAPLRRIGDRVAAEHPDLAADAARPYLLARLVPGSGKQALAVMDRMGEVLRGVPGGREREFLAFLAAKRALNYYENGLRPGIGATEEELRSLVQSQEEEFGQHQRRLLGIYNAAVEDSLVTAGIMSRQRFDALRSRWPDYVPFLREQDGDSVSHYVGGSGARVVSLQDPILKASGVRSDDEVREIRDPLLSMARNVGLFYGLAARNEAGKSVVRLSRSAPGLGWLAEPVKGGPEGARTGIFHVWESGTKRTYATDPDVYRVLMGLDRRSRFDNAIWSAMRQVSEVFKLGTTRWNPTFVLTNLWRDGVATSINSRTWAPPFYHLARGMLMQFSGDPAQKAKLQRAIDAGVFYSGITEAQQEHMKRSLRESFHHGGVDRARNLLDPRNWFRFIGEINAATEVSGKLAEFDMLTDRGIPDEEAAVAAREVNTDFQRGGVWGRTVNEIVPFFNASIQGTDKFARTLRERPVQTAAKVLLYVVLPSVLTWLWNHDDEERARAYEEVNPRVRDTYWLFPASDGGFWRLPKPFEMGMFGSFVERGLSAMMERDPHAFEGFGKGLSTSLLPRVLPAVLAPWIEVGFNRNFFFESPIVPDSKAWLPKPLQYQESTSEVAKILGSVAGLSPMQVDHVIRGYTGSVGDVMIGMADPLLRGILDDGGGGTGASYMDTPGVRSFRVAPFRNSASVRRFYARYEKLQESAVGARVEHRPVPNAPLLAKMNQARERLSRIWDAKRAIQTSAIPADKQIAAMARLDRAAADVAFWANRAWEDVARSDERLRNDRSTTVQRP